MSRDVNVLHIEDDHVQRLVIAHHLKTMEEFRFAITCVDSEDAATAAFQRGSTDLVILDYHLAQGNGLSCLRTLRRHNTRVPIVAVSGMATPQIARELLDAGADDYLNKQDLDSSLMARSIRHILARTEALSQGAFAAGLMQTAQIETLIRQTCATFHGGMVAQFFSQLDALEDAARQANLNAERLQQIFERVCRELELSLPRLSRQPWHRPVLLELLVRLFGTKAPAAESWHD